MLEHLTRTWRQARKAALSRQAEYVQRLSKAKDPRSHVFSFSHPRGGLYKTLIVLTLLLFGLFLVDGGRIVVALRWLVAIQIVHIWVYWNRANLEKRGHESDALYIRPYKDSISWSHAFEGTSFLQLAARRAIYPPYDLIYVLPPPSTDVQHKAEALGGRAHTTPYVVRTRDDLDWLAAIEDLLATHPVLIIECTTMSFGLKREIDMALPRMPSHNIVLVARKPLSKEAIDTVDYVHQSLLESGCPQSDLPGVIECGAFRDRAFTRSLREKLKELVSLDETTFRRRNLHFLYTRILWAINCTAQIATFACILWILYIMLIRLLGG